MNSALKQARASVRVYLAAVEQDQVTFIRLYVEASDACAHAGVTLGQVRVRLMDEERAARVAALMICDDDEDEIEPAEAWLPPLSPRVEGGAR